VGEKPPPRGKAVLVVDDDADVRETLADAVEGAGRQVLMAQGGAEALELLNEAPRPCLVLLDLKMWPMGGAEFLQRLQARPDASDFPVVLVTGDRDQRAARKAPGVVALLAKPFDVEALRAVLNQFC
jgi:CheY-like chemotaxis protein